MRMIGRHLLLISVLSAPLCGVWLRAQTAKPQVVRLSLIDGDVSVSRGKHDERGDKINGALISWETAQVNLTLKPEYSLATGTGHAEIAFEDGSTMYLGQNSLISFGKVNSTRYEVDLVSGTLSFNLHPLNGGWYKVTTPTDQVEVEYPERSALRVDAYLDGMALTASHVETVRVNEKPVQLDAGRVTLLRDGKTLDATGVQAASPLFGEWDAWVAQRISTGGAALTAAGYTIPNEKALTPLKRVPRIIPRTVAQASVPDWSLTKSSSSKPVWFSPQSQGFIFRRPGEHGPDLLQADLLGGGPSAIHPGKRGAMKRDPKNPSDLDKNPMGYWPTPVFIP